MKSFGLFALIFGFAVLTQAQSKLVHGDSLQETSLELALAQVQPGSIVVVGENHGFKNHQAQQIQVMQTLRNRGLKVAVGMEFFYFPQQAQLDDYRAGLIAEADFLKAINWGSPSFDFYRDQALFPLATEGAKTVALNSPSSLTRKISKGGLASLTDEDRALLPPDFQLGNKQYKERFMSVMGNHFPDPSVAENYFAAQSTWDDTMAWYATEYLRSNSDQVMVIIVGEFHSQYGGGLPDRLRVRGAFPVLTISQFNTAGLTADEITQDISPSSAYGPRADFIWSGPAQ